MAFIGSNIFGLSQFGRTQGNVRNQLGSLFVGGSSFGGGFNFTGSFGGNAQLGRGWNSFASPAGPWSRPGWPQAPQVGPWPTTFSWSNINGVGGQNLFFPGFGRQIV